MNCTVVLCFRRFRAPKTFKRLAVLFFKQNTPKMQNLVGNLEIWGYMSYIIYIYIYVSCIPSWWHTGSREVQALVKGKALVRSWGRQCDQRNHWIDVVWQWFIVVKSQACHMLSETWTIVKTWCLSQFKCRFDDLQLVLCMRILWDFMFDQLRFYLGM